MNLYWASHQRFFIQLVLGMKVPSAVQLAKESLEAGKCVRRERCNAYF